MIIMTFEIKLNQITIRSIKPTLFNCKFIIFFLLNYIILETKRPKMKSCDNF